MDRRLALGLLLLIPFAVAAQQGRASGNAARIVTSITENARIALPGNTNPLARPEFDRGAAPADLPMERMMLVLRRSPEQQRRLDEYVASLGDKKSPNYRHWLTPEEFGAQFGIAQSDIDAVSAWLRSNGFVPGRVSNGQTVLEFSGTAAQVEAAFHTEIRSYQIGGKQHYANARDPEIPAALSRVVAGVAMLHNWQQVETRFHVPRSTRQRGTRTCPGGFASDLQRRPAADEQRQNQRVGTENCRGGTKQYQRVRRT